MKTKRDKEAAALSPTTLAVLERVFRGDPHSMLAYAEQYVAGGSREAAALGKEFRDLVSSRNRTVFWRTVAERLPQHIASDGGLASRKRLPSWCELAGGNKRWEDWMSRGKKAPRGELLAALWRCGGRGFYSRLPLTLDPAARGSSPEDAMYPSIEHSRGRSDRAIEIECRLVNDMKSLLEPEEFGALVAHLAAAMRLSPTFLPDGWHPKRSFRPAE